jgi:translation initiation factor IF-3
MYNPHAPRALRKNDRIRALEVRVIGPDGKQVGVLQTRDAIRLAQTHRLDLVEVSPGTRPPVCRILDYGKYMYDEGKKQKGHKTHASKLKEVKFRPRIEAHDYITKLRHAEEFLFHGDKVKMTLFFKGRELEHKELGFETVKRALGDLAHVGLPDQQPRLMGRNITLTLSALPVNKRKLKYNLREGEVSPPAHDREHDHDHGHHEGHGHQHEDRHGHEDSGRPQQARPPTPTGAVTSLGDALAQAQAAPPPPAPPSTPDGGV